MDVRDEGLNKFLKLLDDLGLRERVDIILHSEVGGKRTEDAATALGVSPEHVLKCLIFRGKEGDVAAIITGNRKVDVRKLEKVSGVKRLRLARPDEVEELMGYKVGGVPPFVFKGMMRAFVDVEVMSREFVIGAAGTEYAGVKFNPKIFEELGYEVADIAKR